MITTLMFLMLYTTAYADSNPFIVNLNNKQDICKSFSPKNKLSFEQKIAASLKENATSDQPVRIFDALTVTNSST